MTDISSYIPCALVTQEQPISQPPAPPTEPPPTPESIATLISQLSASIAPIAPTVPQHTPSSAQAPSQERPFITADGRTQLTLANACRIRAVAPRNEPVLITGPSGTGKELLARMIHHGGPFVAVNVALPETLVHSTLFGHTKGAFTGAVSESPGAFRAAGNGTIFLDEIGDMPLSQQTALLRVIQERVVVPVGSVIEYPLNCRIVAATNRSDSDPAFLRLDIAARFLHILKLTPLAERPDDTTLLARHYGLSPEGLAALDPEDLLTYNTRAIQRAAARERLFRT